MHLVFFLPPICALSSCSLFCLALRRDLRLLAGGIPPPLHRCRWDHSERWCKWLRRLPGGLRCSAIPPGSSGCGSTSSPPPKEEKKETFIRKSCHAQNDYDSVSFNPFLFHLTNSFLKNFFFLLVDNDVRRPMHEKSELAAMACSTHTVVVVDLLPVIKFYPGLGCS